MPLLRAARRDGGRRNGGPLILLYHRVAAADTDPQRLAVTPEHFAEHLRLIAGAYEPIALSHLVAAVGAGRAVPRAVAVTFDDGYADNLLAAKPLLEQAGVPATMFIATRYVREGRPFWWDELERILLRPGRLPAAFTLSVSGHKLRFELGDDATYTSDIWTGRVGWTVLHRGDPGPRQAVYRDLCARLRVLDEAEREAALQSLGSLVEPDDGRVADAPRPLTPDELVRLADGALIDVGAHAVSHPVLAQLPRWRQEEEVAGSKRELEDTLGRLLVSFAYPYGARSDFDKTAVSLVRAAGFDHACTSIPGRLTPRTDRFRIPRAVVRDCTGAELERRLSEVAV